MTTEPPVNTADAAVGAGGNLFQVGGGTGDIYINSSAPAEPVRPYRAGAVPLPAAHFQPRDAVPVEGTVVLCGLGGAGKTQFAAHLAQTLWQVGELDLLLWVTATSREAVVSAYAGVAADVLGSADADPERGAQRFAQWLNTSGVRWLVVLDDVRAPNHLRGLWPPPHPTGRVVVTSRSRHHALVANRTLVDVDVFTPEQSFAYLDAVLPGQDPDQLRGLAEDLGHLPLALAQAAAHVADRLLTCADYRERLADRRRSLVDLLPEDDALPDEHTASVAATWSMSVELADAMRPVGLARPLLELASVLDPNGVPLAVLTAPAARAHLAAAAGRDVAADEVRDATACLHVLSLLGHDPGGGHRAVRVHGLVQRTTREACAPPRLAAAARAAADALVQVWPEVERDRDLAHVLRANADALHDHAGPALLRPHAHPVLFRTGDSLGEGGLIAEATAHLERLVAELEAHHSSDDLATLTARNNLIRWTGVVDPAAAASESERLLPDLLRVLGPDDRTTSSARVENAALRGRAGHPSAARAAFDALVPELELLFGPDDAVVLLARAHAAEALGMTERPGAAVAVLEGLLPDLARVCGRDHPDVLAVRSSLVRWRVEAGDRSAVAGAEALLADHVRLLGPEHPRTLGLRGRVASWRAEDSDPAETVFALETLLTDLVRVLGPSHTAVLTTRGDLALWRSMAGDTAAAVTALEELLADASRFLEPTDPVVLGVRGGLAAAHVHAGAPDRAAKDVEALLDDLVRVHPPGHPDVLDALEFLAQCRFEMGDEAGGNAVLEDLNAARARLGR
ncbi:NB-ARC domain-containing protein [Umezawaea beigongshangensis]|uniref:NB-ARC domain-containing protein n=1 Tax=Umezawaea beigongshangensis TaxID=2780383 RepID=UPI0018F14BFC|nr:NB-ARC domain-containing protein [Umezawaea beigongshangensis]